MEQGSNCVRHGQVFSFRSHASTAAEVQETYSSGSNHSAYEYVVLNVKLYYWVRITNAHSIVHLCSLFKSMIVSFP